MYFVLFYVMYVAYRVGCEVSSEMSDVGGWWQILHNRVHVTLVSLDGSGFES